MPYDDKYIARRDNEVFSNTDPQIILGFAAWRLENYNRNYGKIKANIDYCIRKCQESIDYWENEYKTTVNRRDREVARAVMYRRVFDMEALHKCLEKFSAKPALYQAKIAEAERKIRDHNARFIIAPCSPMIGTSQYWKNRRYDYESRENEIAVEWVDFLEKTQKIPMMFLETNAIEAHLQNILVELLPDLVINMIQDFVHFAMKQHRRDMYLAKRNYFVANAMAKTQEQLRVEFGPGWDYVAPKSRNGRRTYDLAMD